MEKDNKVLSDDNLKDVNGGLDNESLIVVDDISGKLEYGEDFEIFKDEASGDLRYK